MLTPQVGTWKSATREELSTSAHVARELSSSRFEVPNHIPTPQFGTWKTAKRGGTEHQRAGSAGALSSSRFEVLNHMLTPLVGTWKTATTEEFSTSGSYISSSRFEIPSHMLTRLINTWIPTRIFIVCIHIANSCVFFGVVGFRVFLERVFRVQGFLGLGFKVLVFFCVQWCPFCFLWLLIVEILVWGYLEEIGATHVNDWEKVKE